MHKYKLPISEIGSLYYGKGLSQQAIADRFGVSQWVICHRMKEEGWKALDKTRRFNPRKYKIDHNAFSRLDNKTAWLLGWVSSDGYVKRSGVVGLKVSFKDKDIAEKLRNYLCYTGPLHIRRQFLQKTNKAYKQISLEAFSRNIVERLASFGIVPNKSLTLKFPAIIIKSGKEEIIRNYIRGLFEGDGSLLVERRSSLLFQIVGTYEICVGVQRCLIKYLGVSKTKLTNNITGKNHFAVRYRGRLQVLKIMDWLYKKAYNNVLERKYRKHLLIKEEFA